MPRFKVTLSIGYQGAEHEDVIDIDDDDWSDCETDEQRETMKNAEWQEWANGSIEGCIEIVE